MNSLHIFYNLGALITFVISELGESTVQNINIIVEVDDIKMFGGSFLNESIPNV